MPISVCKVKCPWCFHLRVCVTPGLIPVEAYLGSLQKKTSTHTKRLYTDRLVGCLFQRKYANLWNSESTTMSIRSHTCQLARSSTRVWFSSVTLVKIWRTYTTIAWGTVRRDKVFSLLKEKKERRTSRRHTVYCWFIVVPIQVLRQHVS